MYIIYYWLNENGNPFYVRATSNFSSRMKRHICNMKDGSTLPKYNKLRKVLASGIQMKDVMIPQETLSSQKALFKREIELIALLPKQGYKLYNLTEGGEGGFPLSKEAQARAVRKRKGYRHSEETKRKISESNIGKKHSNEHKAKLSIARRKRIITDETKKKTSKTSKGKINIKEYKLTSPNGKTYITTNGLTLFCKQNNLSAPNLHRVLRGVSSHHKGWTIERI